LNLHSANFLVEYLEKIVSNPITQGLENTPSGWEAETQLDRRQIKIQAKKVMLTPRRPSLFIVTMVFLLIGVILAQMDLALSDVGRFQAEALQLWTAAATTAAQHGVFTLPAELPAFTFTVLGTLFFAVFLIFQWIMSLGYVYYIRGTVKGETLGFRSLFEGFNYFIRGFFIRLIQTVIVILGLFFFVVPGIVAMCAFSQIHLLLLDHPDKNVFWYFGESRRLMQGKKMAYFQLVLSFFGWFILQSIPVISLAISLWLEPYFNASKVFFYQEITGQGPTPETQWKRPEMF